MMKRYDHGVIRVTNKIVRLQIAGPRDMKFPDDWKSSRFVCLKSNVSRLPRKYIESCDRASSEFDAKDMQLCEVKDFKLLPKKYQAQLNIARFGLYSRYLYIDSFIVVIQN